MEHEKNNNSSSFFEELKTRELTLIEKNGVKTRFPLKIEKMFKDDIVPHSAKRTDLRDMITFPIDCDDTKDRDDALSYSFDGIHHLGVHIADVSAYVPPNSVLDREATERCTSIYLPTVTIPMLPDVLSKDLCSLCCEDKLTISTLIDIDSNGNLLGYHIVKSIIHPALIATYSEVNEVLAKTASDTLMEKYKQVVDILFRLKELASILRNRRTIRGVDTASDKAPPKVIFQDNTVELIPDLRGIAGMIVEESMIIANYCVADYFCKKELPAIYRTQSEVNNLAEYHYVKSYHASLMFEQYAHTTSPIRRLSDLRMQQILSAHLFGCGNEALHYMFDDYLLQSCEIATKRSRRAKDLQKACYKLCWKEYFRKHTSDKYYGVVSGFGKQNEIYVQLNELHITISVFGILASLGTTLSLRINTNYPGSSYSGYDVRTA